MELAMSGFKGDHSRRDQSMAEGTIIRTGEQKQKENQAR